MNALHYLQAELKVIHRDVKPSNILINRNGQVKMCDFGISGNLVDSVAKTIDAGCKPYMAVGVLHLHLNVLSVSDCVLIFMNILWLPYITPLQKEYTLCNNDKSTNTIGQLLLSFDLNDLNFASQIMHKNLSCNWF